MAWYTDKKRLAAIRKYSSRRAMEREMQRAAQFGWQVADTVSYTRRPLWRLIIPIWWLFGTSGFMVTYRRQA